MTQLAMSSEVAAQSPLAPVQEGGTLQDTGLLSRGDVSRAAQELCQGLCRAPSHAQPPATGWKHTVVLRRAQHSNPPCSKDTDGNFFPKPEDEMVKSSGCL